MLSEAQDLLAVMFKRNVQPDSGMLVQVRGLGFGFSTQGCLCRCVVESVGLGFRVRVSGFGWPFLLKRNVRSHVGFPRP